MKRFWHSWLAVVATVTMICPVAAQNNLGNMSEIGSYQSILSRAGYSNNNNGNVGYNQPAVGYNQPAISAPVMANPINAPYRQEVTGEVVGGHGSVHGAVGPVVNGAGCGTNGGGCGTMGADPAYAGYSSGAGGYVVGNGGGAAMDCNSCAQGDVYNSVGYSAPYMDAGVAAAPVYVPGNMGVGGRGRGNSNSNYVVGVRGLFFDRDYESHKGYSFNPAGDRLYSTDADHGTMGGVDVSFQKRGCNNRGWEVRYWGLYPNAAVASLSGAPVAADPNFRGWDQLNHSGFDLYSIFGEGTTHTITRNTDITNIEYNLLSNAGCYTTRRGRRASVEILGGFRWFQFNESLNFNSTTAFAGYPASVDYLNEVENTLLGFQLGGRSEICMTRRLRFNAATKFGIYNNRVNARQSIQDSAGTYATVATGPWTATDYNVNDQKDDLAFLGELDLGLSLQLGHRSRAVFGYRAVAVSGIALAERQVPYDWTDLTQIGRTNTDSSLLLHGGYAGLEFCF